jgi:hypothetical protein
MRQVTEDLNNDVLRHLARYRIYEERPMPWSTTAMGIIEALSSPQARTYRALNYLEAAGHLTSAMCYVVGTPEGRRTKPKLRCFTITPEGREALRVPQYARVGLVRTQITWRLEKLEWRQ